jgi:alkylation response protein AidB-like acyl-CoA dehydrogenase
MTTSTAEFDGVLALAAERSAASEQMGRLDPDVVAALAHAGVNRALLPAALGGREAHPRELIDAVARIAAADGSTGWCVSISAGCNLFAGYVSEPAARDMYVDPDVGLAGMFAALGVATTTAHTGRGVATTLTGRWPFASNCLHSRWIVLGSVVRDEQGTTEPMPRMIIVPTEDLVIEDTWRSAGLRATGSHHVRADDVPIDLARSCTFAGRSWADGPLWRMPMFTVLGSVLVAAPLGIARAAVDELLDVVSAGAGSAMRGLLVNDPVGLAELAAVDAALRAAYAGVVAAVDEVWEDAVAGRRAARSVQARVVLAMHHAIDTAVEAVSTAHRLCGGTAAYSGHRLLTALLDIHTARQHISLAHYLNPALIRIAVGIDESAPPFVV